MGEEGEDAPQQLSANGDDDQQPAVVVAAAVAAPAAPAAKTAKYAITRGRGKKLDLRRAQAGDRETLLVNGFHITALFGDIFQPVDDLCPAGSGWLPVIPDYRTGVLYNLWRRMGGPTEKPACAVSENGRVRMIASRAEPIESDEDGSAGPSSAMPEKIKVALFYHYDPSAFKYDEDFTQMARMAPEGSVLALPCIGTNFCLSYYESAFRMMYSLLGCLADPDSPLYRLLGVVFITPYSDDQANTSTRTMQHLFNLFDVYRNTREEPECAICAAFKEDTILSCGHRYCMRCVMDCKSKCPRCRASPVSAHLCYEVKDSSDYLCHQLADGEKPPDKVPMVYTPCGHMNVLCDKCTRVYPTTQCPICGVRPETVLRLYPS